VKAVILSAGQGKRLLPFTESRPKCLLRLAGRTLLEWQVRALAANGITDVVVVTGFATDMVEAVLDQIRLPGVRIRARYNPFFAIADNIASCYVAFPEMDGPFVLVNGDTLFEPAILATALAEARLAITITIDRKPAYDTDDMKVQVAERRLQAVGKTLPPETVNGESIGMLVFRDGGGALFRDAVEAILREPDGPRRWYLSAIDRLAKAGVVGATSIAGRRWAEVDFPEDVGRAEDLVQACLAGVVDDTATAVAMAAGAGA